MNANEKREFFDRWRYAIEPTIIDCKPNLYLPLAFFTSIRRVDRIIVRHRRIEFHGYDIELSSPVVKNISHVNEFSDGEYDNKLGIGFFDGQNPFSHIGQFIDRFPSYDTRPKKLPMKVFGHDDWARPISLLPLNEKPPYYVHRHVSAIMLISKAGYVHVWKLYREAIDYRCVYPTEEGEECLKLLL